MKRFLFAGFCILLSAPAAAEGVFRKNPFNRPDFMANAQEGSQPPLREERREPLKLKATLLSAKGGLANIGGTTIAVGEVHDGYRLLSVTEGKAILERDGERIVLQLFEAANDEK